MSRLPDEVREKVQQMVDAQDGWLEDRPAETRIALYAAEIALEWALDDLSDRSGFPDDGEFVEQVRRDWFGEEER